MRYVIIPSSKYAPQELYNYGRIPMALYPINDETILNLILKQYSKDDRFIITAFEGASSIKRYVSLLKRKEITVRVLDKLKDIGYSIYCALNSLTLNDGDEVIINYADTVVDNNDLLKNSIVYVPTNKISSKWTYVLEENGVIKDIIDKKTCSCSVDNLKTICGVISIKEPKILLDILKKDYLENGKTFYECLAIYSTVVPFAFVNAINWLDLGHPSEYFDSKIAVKSRKFNHMVFDKDRGILKKTSDDKEKFKGEIEWYLKLPSRLKYVIPRVFSSSTSYEDMYIEMEFYSYPTLLELSLYGNLDVESWTKIFSKVKFVLNDFRRYSIKSDRIKKSLYDMYYTKTVSRLNSLREDENFKPFFDNPIVVNGVKYQSLNKIVGMLDDIVKTKLLNVDTFHIIHGDLCFANILITDNLNFIKLVDPRGNFGGFDIYGDDRYELAKLIHSVDGKYDYIIKDLFDVNVDGNNINLKFEDNGLNLYPILKETLKDLIQNRLPEIELIEALLFLSMIPLHNENRSHQYAMLAVGLSIMDRIVDIKEKEE